jgi:4-amino-4-deoxy-L-arabinose transferase-like glycosyltransferase
MTLNTKTLTHFLLIGVMACAVALTVGNAFAADAKPNPITAIDILLEPDATMIQHAAATNDRLRKVFPKGFALDASHRPHVTLVQRFVRTEDLDKVYAAVGKVFAAANVTGLKLEAFKYYYMPDKDLGLSGIVIKPTPELLALEKQVIDAVTPFVVETGTSAAFVTTPEDPEVLPELITYVSEFVPKHSGENYHPHVTTGLATKEYLDKMLAEPFETFTFSPAGAAVYHLGHFGTAAKQLHQFKLKP